MLILLLTQLACTDSGPSDDTSSTGMWCEDTTQLNTEELTEGTGSGSSGQVIGRLIETVELPGEDHEDLHDTKLVGFVDYTMRNIDVGGSATQSKTNEYGDFDELLGEGHWEFKASTQRQGYLCSSELEFTVVGGMTTNLCAHLACSAR